MSSDFPTHSEIGEENARQYMQRRCRERAEYGDAREDEGGVNRHLVKAGETWHYHFDRDCTVLLVFDEDE